MGLPRSCFLTLILALLWLSDVTANEPLPVEFHETGAAFDQLFAHLDQAIVTESPEVAAASLVSLHALLPANDTYRQWLYKYITCIATPSDIEHAIKQADSFLAEAEQANDKEAQARFHLCRGSLYERARTTAEAMAEYTSSIAFAREVNSSNVLGQALGTRSGGYSFHGEQALALIDALEAQHVFEQAGLNDLADMNLLNIGMLYRRMGEFTNAEKYLLNSRDLAERSGTWNALSVALLQLGFLYQDRQQPEQALIYFEEVLARSKSRNDLFNHGAAQLAMAGALNDSQQYQKALQHLEMARADFAATGTVQDEGMLQFLEAQARAGLGDQVLARAHFDRAEAEFQSAAQPRYLAMLYRERSRNLEALGLLREALDDQKRYLEIREQLQQKLGDQRSQLWRHQFAQEQHDQECDALKQAKRWRVAALVSGIVAAMSLLSLGLWLLWRNRRLVQT